MDLWALWLWVLGLSIISVDRQIDTQPFFSSSFKEILIVLSWGSPPCPNDTEGAGSFRLPFDPSTLDGLRRSCLLTYVVKHPSIYIILCLLKSGSVKPTEIFNNKDKNSNFFVSLIALSIIKVKSDKKKECWKWSKVIKESFPSVLLLSQRDEMRENKQFNFFFFWWLCIA